jgi:hypothetical protein
MNEISPLVRRHILRLFEPAQQREVARLLRDDCAAALSDSKTASPKSVERIQCAALKASGGKLDKLYDAIALAQTDWRDLLVAAGFANDPRAHLDWRD